MNTISSLIRKIKGFFTKERKAKDYCPSESDKSEYNHIDWTTLLPDPVLKVVFEYYTFGTLTSQSSVSASPLFVDADPRFGPLCITHVCGRWRHIAISMAHLWSSIRVSNNHHPDLLKQWIQRSKDQPLSLSLDCVYPPRIDANTNPHVSRPFEPHQHLYHSRINIALRLIATEMRRWRRLDITLDFESASAFMQMSLVNASNLMQISIQFTAVNAASMPPQLLQFMDNSLDSLSSLRLLTWDSALPREQMFLPLRNHDILDRSSLWKRLDQIQLRTGLTMNEAVAFLSCCVNASFVAIECIVNNEMDDGELESISTVGPKQGTILTLLKLKELSVGFGGAACDCTRILERFTFPSLQSLCIYNFETRRSSCYRIEDLVNRSMNIDQDSPIDQQLCRAKPPSTGLHLLLIKDEYMSEEIVFQLIRIPALQCIPILNLYTRKPVKWEVISETLRSLSVQRDVEHMDLWCGTWIGWGGFPGSSQY
ncbi:hypothetical protein BDN70DRAFT_880857 [Pholiota conissans]|uniref:F-box domain-containing protein n=1 Tax=Pholiota conissans TaxID=109636 RepID=A0A9P6CSV0_9AGAR|nr:hypothetical protein BDN70DRAFT_880857 [Pholiota conissans]